MAEVIKMPRMSDTMTEGVIVSWLKKPGDQVKTGDVLAEVETDKATMELESYFDGTLLYVGVKEGDTVPVDAVLAVIGKQGEDYQALLNQGAASAPLNQAVPGQQNNNAPAGNAAQQAQPAQQTEQQPSQQQQTSQQPQASQQSEQAQQQQAPQQQQPQQQENATQQQPAETSEKGRVMASPLARKIAEDKGISLQQVAGSGDNGRIVKKDVENYIPPKQQAASAAQPAANAQPGQEGYQDITVSQMRKTIARRLAESKFTSPHFYITVDVNMGRMMAARKKMNDYLGEKVSFNDIIIRTVAAALRKHPKINGSWLGDKIRYYDHIHIGVAIAVEDGLVVPVIKFADTKAISQIAAEVKVFADKAKNKKLQPQDFEGNTFTISNMGMFGIEDFTAIINPPDACILAVGSIRETPIVDNGEIKAGSMMKLTLSCDHRIVDGATGARFLETLKQLLEEPAIILA